MSSSDGLSQCLARQKQARPIQLAQVTQLDAWLGSAILAAQQAGDHAAGLRHTRNRALLLLGFWRGFRGDELARLRVEDVHAHHARAQERGARILRPPTDYFYGERQYTVVDPGGHCWTFSQSIADIHPSDWGGTPVQL